MAKKTQALRSRPRHSDLVYGLVAPYSFLDVFAYLRFGGAADAADAQTPREDAEFYSYRKWRAARSKCV